MGNSPLDGLQFLPDNFQVALATLNSNVALQIAANYATGLKRAFLLKHLKCYGTVSNFTAGDSVIVGFAFGSMSVSEIRNALIDEIPDPNEFTEWEHIIQKKGILWQTLEVVDAERPSINIDVKIGGRNGIPLTPGEGVQMFAFNYTSVNMTTGALASGVYLMEGAWLKDSIA